MFLVDDVALHTSVGIKTLDNVAINASPNPVSDILNHTNVKGASITIFNLMGTPVASIENASAQCSLSMRSYAEGTYLIEIIKGNKAIIKKINLIK